jgi:hypothetical protein
MLRYTTHSRAAHLLCKPDSAKSRGSKAFHDAKLVCVLHTHAIKLRFCKSRAANASILTIHARPQFHLWVSHSGRRPSMVLALGFRRRAIRFLSFCHSHVPPQVGKGQIPVHHLRSQKAEPKRAGSHSACWWSHGLGSRPLNYTYPFR